jgi:hypothetical protein
MSSELLSSDEPRGSAGPAGARHRHRSWRPCVMATVAVVALLGGTGVADAATASGPPVNASATGTFQLTGASQLTGSSKILLPSVSQPGPGPFGGSHGFGPGGILPLHGQAVLAKPGGGYVTLAFQRGAITKVSASSITVKSNDGFTQSFAITGSTVVSAGRDGIASAKAGNQAVVIATVSGGTATAVKIIDWTMLQHTHQQFGFGPMGQG